jgi:hypothetical protein
MEDPHNRKSIPKRYPPFYEKLVPAALIVIVVCILILLVVVAGVLLDWLPGWN